MSRGLSLVSVLWGHDDDVVKFVSDRLGIALFPPYTGIGLLDEDGILIGGAVFTNYTKFNIDGTIYAPGKLSRHIVRALAHFCFVHCGVLRVTVKTRRSNLRVTKMLPKFGFAYEATLRRYFGPQKPDDAIQFRLDREAPVLRRMRLFDGN